MKHDEARDLLDLLFSFMEAFHEKFLHRFRKRHEHYSLLKKNHVKIISMLYRNNSLTSTELAKRLDIEKGSVTTLIDQLTDLGLVERGSAPDDRRKCLILLTDSGKAEMESIKESDTVAMNELLRDIPTQDLRKFIESLNYAVEFINKL